LEESAAVLAFRGKMVGEEAQTQYRRRGSVVEFCHAWIKSKMGLRQFHLRGPVKVGTELLWACLTYNPQIGSDWVAKNEPCGRLTERGGTRKNIGPSISADNVQKTRPDSLATHTIGFLHNFKTGRIGRPEKPIQ
jgi:hypothetical protein